MPDVFQLDEDAGAFPLDVEEGVNHRTVVVSLFLLVHEGADGRVPGRGIIGGIALVGLFLLLLWRIFSIALKAPDLYGALIATGVFGQIAIQVLMNIAVVTNSMPATGVPLPFVSYGGSNLLILMAEIGVVLNVSKKTVDPIPDDEDAEDDMLLS